jgi:uncharacterized protein (DUF736 family)
MAYEHKEGKGSIFPNDYKLQDTHPDFRGKAMWKGEIIEISLWEGETQAGVKKFSVSISEPRQKSEAHQRVVSSSPKAPQPKFATAEDDNDSIPF